MIFYISLFILCVGLILFTNKEIYVKLSYIILGATYALRDSLSIDDGGYIQAFNHINMGWDFDIEFTYKFISKFTSFIGMNYKLVFFIYASLAMYFLYKATKLLYSRNLEKAIYLSSFFGIIFITSVSVMRQFLAATIVFYAIAHYIENHKSRVFIILVIIASCFHYAALISIIFYIALKVGAKITDKFRLMIVVLSVILGSINIVGIVIKSLWFLLPESYSLYSDSVTGKFSGAGGTLQYLLLVLFMIICLSSMKNNKNEKVYKTEIIKTGQMIYLSLIFLLTNAGVASRLAFTFIPFAATIPYMFSKLFIKKDQNFIRFLSVTGMFFLLLFTLNAVSNDSEYFIPYRASFDFISQE